MNPGRVYGILYQYSEDGRYWEEWSYRSHCRLCGWSAVNRRWVRAQIIMLYHLKRWCNGRIDNAPH